jgi:hypothetical protein
MGQSLYLDLQIAPEWARIDPLRQAIALCLGAVFVCEDLKDALSMVTAELVENAIKYGKSDATSVRLQIEQQSNELVIAVTNFVEKGSHHHHVLNERIDWISSYPDPSAAYMAALAQVYEKVGAHGAQGGIGLVRIAYEGGCSLSCDVEGEERLVVRAHYPITPELVGTENGV